MKKILVSLILLCLSMSVATAGTDKYSKEYLQSKKHFAIVNPFVENMVERALKKELKKQTGANFKVKFTGYTTSSMKQGIFKELKLTGKNVEIDKIPVSYIHLESLSDYNYIDYTKNPILYKSDMEFAYDITLTEDSLNAALKNDKYDKIIKNVNRLAYPLFYLTEIRTKIINDKLYIIMDYNLPVKKVSKDRTFVASSGLKVEKGKIKAKDVHIDSLYGNLGLDRVANLINLLNPLEFTLDMMDSKNCKGNIENVNIIDNTIKVDGKIFVKADKK